MQAQQISLNYHCKCEQFVHFASGGFFNFNGTAGLRCTSQVCITQTAAALNSNDGPLLGTTPHS